MEDSHSVHISKLNGFSATCISFSKDKKGVMDSKFYEISVNIKAKNLNTCCFVTDFGLVTPITKEICSNLDGFCLIPLKNENIKLIKDEVKAIYCIQ